MSLREMIENRPALGDLPILRKLLMIGTLLFAMSVGIAGVDQELTIDGAAPDHPMPATGQIYRLDVMHGDVRYVTLREKENPLNDGRAGSWAGAAVLGGFFLWISFRKGTAGKPK